MAHVLDFSRRQEPSDSIDRRHLLLRNLIDDLQVLVLTEPDALERIASYAKFVSNIGATRGN